jgi:hypothetical protein
MSNSGIRERFYVNQLSGSDQKSKVLWSINFLKILSRTERDNNRMDIQFLIFNIVNNINFAEVIYQFNNDFHDVITYIPIEELITNAQIPILEAISNRLELLNINNEDIEFIISYLVTSRWLISIVGLCLNATASGRKIIL